MSNNNIDWRVIAAIIAAFTGVYGWLLKHLSNSKKHPCADDIVFEKNCEARRDCIESSVEGLKEYSKERFDRIEELIKDARK